MASSSKKRPTPIINNSIQIITCTSNNHVNEKDHNIIYLKVYTTKDMVEKKYMVQDLSMVRNLPLSEQLNLLMEGIPQMMVNFNVFLGWILQMMVNINVLLETKKKINRYIDWYEILHAKLVVKKSLIKDQCKKVGPNTPC